jgi:hypothetical protein
MNRTFFRSISFSSKGVEQKRRRKRRKIVVKAKFCSGKFMAHESLIFILFNKIYRPIIRN